MSSAFAAARIAPPADTGSNPPALAPLVCRSCGARFDPGPGFATPVPDGAEIVVVPAIAGG